MNTLHAQRKLNMSIIEHSPVPALIISSRGVIKLFSPAAEAFFGYAANNVVGTLLNSLIANKASVFYGGDNDDDEEQDNEAGVKRAGYGHHRREPAQAIHALSGSNNDNYSNLENDVFSLLV
uniref:PAS domain-containing protein n=2 Tax=Lygus hesperus TaxID=30085 RepID=A0A146L8F1_LYGHE